MNMKILVTALLTATRMVRLPAIENAAWLARIEDQFADAAGLNRTHLYRLESGSLSLEL
jgi:hypothetical protein